MLAKLVGTAVGNGLALVKLVIIRGRWLGTGQACDSLQMLAWHWSSSLLAVAQCGDAHAKKNGRSDLFPYTRDEHWKRRNL